MIDGVRNRAAIAAVLGACGFQHGALPPDGGAGSDAADALLPGPDAPMADAAPMLCDPADLDLRACYTFDGDTIDRSGYGNDATASVPAYVPGRTGMALSPVAGIVTVASTTSLDVAALTIKAWIKPNVLPTAGTRMGLVDSASRWRLFLQSDGALRCAISGGADLTTAAGKVVTGTWQRVTCTYDGAQMRIYVDGAMVGSSNMASALPMPGTGMVIGHDNPSGENFNGAIDDLQIWGSIVAP